MKHQLEKKNKEPATKQNKFSFISQILKVIYAPHKAFKEIIQTPKYLGPILIIVLFTVAYVTSGYVLLSKTYYEQVLPALSEGDAWTENSTLWTSNVVILESNDSMNSGYYGNRSIEFSLTNGTQISMQLASTISVNASGSESYKNMSFRVKLVDPESIEPENASIYLFSGQTGDYFYHNLTSYLTPSDSTTWNNITIPIGQDNDWNNSTANADWNNITGLKFEFSWPENVNATVRLDGLFFRGLFTPSIDNIVTLVFQTIANATMQFIIRWAILAGLIFILARGFKVKTGWTALLVLIGFALVTMFVQALINTAEFAVLPKMYYPFESFSGLQPESQIALNKIYEQTSLVAQIVNLTQVITYVWIVALGSIAIHQLTGMSWIKSTLIVAAAFVITLLAESFILGI